MKCMCGFAALLLIMVLVTPVHSVVAPEKNIREAYKMLLESLDANKDGKLSVAECKGAYKDKKMAEKNCTFWDANKDGIITEDEYVKQGQSLGRKK